MEEAHADCNPELSSMYPLGIKLAVDVPEKYKHAMCAPDKPVPEAHVECSPGL